ncbi:MAG: carbohydrate binding family 9 domain-containing protein [Gammaproteobacteria bacterium]|nr:carbohydrate binding family 9 domain-containing protein [Gammaproteobacteria bacterium]
MNCLCQPRVGLCLFVALWPDIALANSSDLPSTNGEIHIDGLLDEQAWQDAARIDIDTETRPGENIPARVKTVAYLVEDGENLYIAFDAADPNPSAIRAYLRDRDSAWNDDFVGIVVDTYGDERRAFEFFANPLGVQMDLTNDDVNKNEDDSWDAIWDSAGQIHAKGFVVEMQIPLSQLRFPNIEGKQTWGIDLLRFYPREHRYRFSNNPQDRNLNCYLCQFEKIQGLEGVEPGRDLEIVPTLTALQSDITDDPGVVPLQSGGTDIEVGANVRWGITPDMTANLAINPDFSQVEADAAQLDINNQFALFFPEKRPFFLEGADYFSTPIQAVFTRTVADPSIGAKLTGKRGNNTFGVFAAEDDITNLIFPGAFGSDSETLQQENSMFVGRYSRSFGDTSSIGGLVTGRSGDGYHNYVGGLDLRWKITDQHSVHIQHLRSDTEYPSDIVSDFDQPLGSFDGDATEASYDYDSRNWFAFLKYRARSATFRADVGFVPQVDFDHNIVGLGRIWHGDEDNWYSRIQVNGNWDIKHDDSGRVLEREIEGYLSAQGPMQSFLEVGALNRDILFDDVMFEETKISLYGEFQPRGGLSAGVWTRWGDQVDFDNTRLGDEIRVEPFINWNINRNLLLRYDGVFVKLDTKEGPNIFDAIVHDVRLTWQFSVHSFLRLTTQFQDIERNPAVYDDVVDAREENLGRQLLYSYKLNPQTVFFLGYSDALIDDDSLSELETTDRTWFMKIGYAWTP